MLRPSEEEILKRWHFKARSGLGGLTRRSRISKTLRGKAGSNHEWTLMVTNFWEKEVTTDGADNTDNGFDTCLRTIQTHANKSTSKAVRVYSRN